EPLMQRTAAARVGARVFRIVELALAFGLDSIAPFERRDLDAVGFSAIGRRLLLGFGLEFHLHRLALSLLGRVDELDALAALGDLHVSNGVDPLLRLDHQRASVLGDLLRLRLSPGSLRDCDDALLLLELTRLLAVDL